MKRLIISLLCYAAFWLLFFFFARSFFLVTHLREAAVPGFNTIAGTFTHGIKLDISATGYIMILPLLALLFYIWTEGKWYKIFLKWYSLLILLVASMIIVADSVLYTYWGYRMDYTPFMYLATPKEAAASVSTISIVVMVSVILLITTISGLIFNRIFRFFFNHPVRHDLKIPATLLFMILCGSLIIPIRGGLGVAPVYAGSVYFSENMFANHASVNVVWNVGSSFINRKPAKNPYLFTDMAAAQSLTDSLTTDTGVTEKVLNNPRPNILIIILESFGNTLVGPLGGDPLTTPNLNKMIDDGLVFSNFYASGNRTDKALPAILNGYPAQPSASIIKEAKKTQSLESLVKIFNGLNYHSSFWYGGDINFADFRSFVISSGFRDIITMENFNRSDFNSKWGVHDHVFFQALRDSMKVVEEPFFRVVLTLSSHEPFEVPMKPVFEGNDNLTKFRNSVYYTDKTLGEFIGWARTTDWWQNTLVVLVADHCRRNSLDELVYSPAIYKIPMLWIGGALNVSGKRMEKFGSQVDIPVTLLRQLDAGNNFRFGKDLLSSGSSSFAFYTFKEGFAFITDTSVYIYDHQLGKPVVEEGRDPCFAGRSGKAYLQVLYDDYLKR
ncbi:MAG: sulfatase-like hydrolase/transferase [Bacteroidales bacterium]|nr:sulfatase-like hydrolase/transferase [Bacteroidales bacterium]